MLGKSIDNALLELRKRIIRGDGEGLAHVEALLSLRGVQMPAVLPAKKPDAARRGRMSWIVMSALRDGPKPLVGVVEIVAAQRPEISVDAAYCRTRQALDRLKRKGLVTRYFEPDGCLWRLVE